MNWVELTKGICNKWSRGRLISPSLPGDRYLKPSSQKRSPGRNLGEHRLVRCSGTMSRGAALLVFSLRMRSFPTTEIQTICKGKKISVNGQVNTRYLLVPGSFTRITTKQLLFSFHVVDLTKTAEKCTETINVRVKRAKVLFFIVNCFNL